MNPSDENTQLEPIRLGPESRFTFQCHKDISCFTQCCKGISIILTPYDIIRLKQRLQLTSDEFLALYTSPQILEKTALPVVTLKLSSEEGNPCPFVTEDGCFVYDDRPATCRYYPLGVASLIKSDEADQGFYFFVNEPHCRGFEEEKEWQVEEWRQDQGVEQYDEVNERWIDLIVRKRSFPPTMRLTEQTKKMFFLASYNIDKFREFVFESSFLQRYDVDDGRLAEIRSDDVALHRFGMDWMLWLLYKRGEFRLKETTDAD